MLDFKFSGIIPLVVWYLVESKPSLQTIPERQYVHFKHKDFFRLVIINDLKLGMIIPDIVK